MSIDEITAKFESILKQQLETKFTEFETKFTKFENNFGDKINNLSEDVAEIRESIGSVYEITARHELVKSYGVEYARPFRLQDIHGLARLILPKRPHLPSEKRDKNLKNTTGILNDRAGILADSVSKV